MAASPTPKLNELLTRLFTKDEPMDDAARAVVQKMSETEHRIAEIRENVKRGVRERERRFRL